MNENKATTKYVSFNLSVEITLCTENVGLAINIMSSSLA